MLSFVILYFDANLWGAVVIFFLSANRLASLRILITFGDDDMALGTERAIYCLTAVSFSLLFTSQLVAAVAGRACDLCWLEGNFRIRQLAAPTLSAAPLISVSLADRCRAARANHKNQMNSNKDLRHVCLSSWCAHPSNCERSNVSNNISIYLCRSLEDDERVFYCLELAHGLYFFSSQLGKWH
jgi:hypothetical protein